jgi:hypothetical protein
MILLIAACSLLAWCGHGEEHERQDAAAVDEPTDRAQKVLRHDDAGTGAVDASVPEEMETGPEASPTDASAADGAATPSADAGPSASIDAGRGAVEPSPSKEVDGGAGAPDETPAKTQDAVSNEGEDGAEATKGESDDELTALLQKVYRDVKSFEADFEQTYRNRLLDRTRESKGHVWLRPP